MLKENGNQNQNSKQQAQATPPTSSNEASSSHDSKKLLKKAILALCIVSPFGLGMVWLNNDSKKISALTQPTHPLQTAADAHSAAVINPASLTPPTITNSTTSNGGAVPSSVAASGSVGGTGQSGITAVETLSRAHDSTTNVQSHSQSKAQSGVLPLGAIPSAGTAPKTVSAKVFSEGCFEFTFKHKPVSSHSDGEACLKHQNLITLQNPSFDLISTLNPSSLCIEVNGEVVRFKRVAGHPDQILIGPEAGPNATITARGCLGKSNCSKRCVLKTDHFMKSLGLEENPEQAQAHKNWNGTTGDSQDDQALAKEVSQSHGLLGSGEKLEGETVFAGWISDHFSHATCTKGGSYADKAVSVPQRTTQARN